VKNPGRVIINGTEIESKLNILQTIRIGNNFTQWDMADLFDVCQSTWSAWEIGHKDPSPERRREIAFVFELSEDDIWEVL
jgi:DNA-binding XRE family transcriptional regulator